MMSEDNLPALGTLLHCVTDPLHVVWPTVVAAAHHSTAFFRFWQDVVSGMLSPTLWGALLSIPTLSLTRPQFPTDGLCQSSTPHQCVALRLVQILLPDLAPHEVYIVLSPSLHCLACDLASTAVICTLLRSNWWAHRYMSSPSA